MAVRIALGAIQSVALAVIPWSCMFAVAIVNGKANSFRQMWFHLVILIGGGLVFFGMSVLISSLVEGEYTAPVVSFGVMLAMTIVMGDGVLRSSSPFGFINGVEFFDRYTGLLTGPIPWAHATTSVAVTAFLVALSVKVVQRREF
jgi:hypothetical protein